MMCVEGCGDVPQGEMSATVVYFPGSYVKLLPDLRQRLAAGQASSGNIKLGVSTNFDKLCGCVLQVGRPFLAVKCRTFVRQGHGVER